MRVEDALDEGDKIGLAGVQNAYAELSPQLAMYADRPTIKHTVAVEPSCKPFPTVDPFTLVSSA